nr:immunoglobulin heavy chain junction region [Macaca mulatta]
CATDVFGSGLDFW